jgi:hypothetical protein
MTIMNVRSYRAAIILIGVAMSVVLAGCGQGTATGQAAGGSAGTGPTGPGTPGDPGDTSPAASASASPNAGPMPTPTIGPAVPPKPKPQPPATSTSRPPSSSEPISGGKPGPSNTGVPKGVALTVVNGDQTYSTAGQVIVGKDFHGFVKVRGHNITFKDCVFRGRAITGNGWLLDTGGASNIVVEDSEFSPSVPESGVNDMWAEGVSVYRSNIHGGVDGLQGGQNILVQDSWIHDMTWFAHDVNQNNGPTHNDGVQGFWDRSGITLLHNNIDLSNTNDPNANLQDGASNVRVEGNWLNGGGCILNFHHKDSTTLTNIWIVNNRFGRSTKFNCPILISTKTVLNQNSGNVWDDTGKPIPPPQQHD